MLESIPLGRRKRGRSGRGSKDNLKEIMRLTSLEEDMFYGRNGDYDICILQTRDEEMARAVIVYIYMAFIF